MGKKVIIFDLDETLRKIEFDSNNVKLRPNINMLLERLEKAKEKRRNATLEQYTSELVDMEDEIEDYIMKTPELKEKFDVYMDEYYKQVNNEKDAIENIER